MGKAIGASVAPSGNESVEVSVRKIDNGFVTRKTHYGDGAYKSSEQFTADKPKIEVGATDDRPAEHKAGSDVMKSAVAALNRSK